MESIIGLVVTVIIGIYLIYDGIDKLKKGRSTAYYPLLNKSITIKDKVVVRLLAITEFILAFIFFIIAACSVIFT